MKEKITHLSIFFTHHFDQITRGCLTKKLSVLNYKYLIQIFIEVSNVNFFPFFS